jgi:hypothetical protein
MPVHRAKMLRWHGVKEMELALVNDRFAGGRWFYARGNSEQGRSQQTGQKVSHSDSGLSSRFAECAESKSRSKRSIGQGDGFVVIRRPAGRIAGCLGQEHRQPPGLRSTLSSEVEVISSFFQSLLLKIKSTVLESLGRERESGIEQVVQVVNDGRFNPVKAGEETLRIRSCDVEH